MLFNCFCFPRMSPTKWFVLQRWFDLIGKSWRSALLYCIGQCANHQTLGGDGRWDLIGLKEGKKKVTTLEPYSTCDENDIIVLWWWWWWWWWGWWWNDDEMMMMMMMMMMMIMMMMMMMIMMIINPWINRPSKQANGELAAHPTICNQYFFFCSSCHGLKNYWWLSESADSVW